MQSTILCALTTNVVYIPNTSDHNLCYTPCDQNSRMLYEPSNTKVKFKNPSWSTVLAP